jgi:hypothetical protein
MESVRPRTAEGKAEASWDAFRHTLTAEQDVLRLEDDARCKDGLEGGVGAARADNPLELSLVEGPVRASVKLEQFARNAPTVVSLKRRMAMAERLRTRKASESVRLAGRHAADRVEAQNRSAAVVATPRSDLRNEPKLSGASVGHKCGCVAFAEVALKPFSGWADGLDDQRATGHSNGRIHP